MTLKWTIYITLLFGGFVVLFKIFPIGTKQTITSTLLEQSSQTTTSMVREELRDIQEKLLTVANNIETSRDFCTNLDSNFSTLKNKVDALFEIDKSNKILCSTNEKFVGSNALDWDSFENFLNDPTHTPTITRIFVTPDNTKVQAAYVPIFDPQKKYIGTIGSATHLANIGNEISKTNSLAQTGYVVLFDDNGDIIYHFDKNLVGKNIWSEEIQNYISRDSGINNGFAQAAKGIITHTAVPYIVRGESRLGEFLPIPAGRDHNLVLLTSLPNY